MTFDERYHRNAETAEGENPPPPMTREGALKTLEALANYLDAGPTAKHHVRELREVLAALSSPCGEPIAEGWAIQAGPYYQGKRLTSHLCFSVFEDGAAYTDEAESEWAHKFGWKPLGRVIILPAEEGAEE